MKNKHKFKRGRWEVRLKYDGVPILKNDSLSDDELEKAFSVAKQKSK